MSVHLKLLYDGDVNSMEKTEERKSDLMDSYYDSLNLKNEILSEYDLDEEVKKIMWLILNGSNFQLTQTLRDFIDQKKRRKALFELFKIIWRLISSENKIWFEEFGNLDVKSLNLDEKTVFQLKNLIKLFEKIINNVSDIKKKLRFTYVLSAIKNEYLEKKDSVTDVEELLKKNLKIGDIILLNKKVDKKDIWTKLLEAYDDNYDTDFWHAAIVISVDPIIIRHSTAFPSDGDELWCVEESSLNWYLARCLCLWYDLLSLRASKEVKDKIMKFSEQNLWKDYDRNAAIWWGLYWRDWEWKDVMQWFKKNLWEKDDSYNCVELIAQALDIDNLKDITHPNEFLEYMNIFTPVYMTTVEL